MSEMPVDMTVLDIKEEGANMKKIVLVAFAALISGLVPGLAYAEEEVSIVRGGRLYDHWSLEAKIRPPSEPHPAFTAKSGGLAAADTWRCVACHGWDYKGNNGIVGIRGRQGGDPAAIVAVLKNSTHGYGDLLRERDLLDIASFVSRGQTDSQLVLETARRLNRVASSFGNTYGTICGSCHGLDGDRLREVPPLGDSSRQRPF